MAGSLESNMAQYLTYNPAIFDAKNLPEAKFIILTPQAGMNTQQRWDTEGPYLLSLMDSLHLNKDSWVLDYGCGIGRMSKLLIDTYDCNVVGVDISEPMRTLAREYVRIKGNKFHVYAPDEFEGENDFDTVLAIWVLQHCHRPQEDIDRIYRLLKPNGKLFVLNMNERVVPCKEITRGWLNDSVDIRGMLANSFTLEKVHELDAKVMGKEVVSGVFCGIYCKNK
jgi:ubiquinone/menaquinone biosynthesis C-methylase UbiE